MDTYNRPSLGLLLMFLVVTIGLVWSTFAAVVHLRHDDQSQLCSERCFPFVGKIEYERCFCADLDENWHPTNW